MAVVDDFIMKVNRQIYEIGCKFCCRKVLKGIKCDICNGWFHDKCAGPDTYSLSDDGCWRCNDCCSFKSDFKNFYLDKKRVIDMLNIRLKQLQTENKGLKKKLYRRGPKKKFCGPSTKYNGVRNRGSADRNNQSTSESDLDDDSSGSVDGSVKENFTGFPSPSIYFRKKVKFYDKFRVPVVDRQCTDFCQESNNSALNDERPIEVVVNILEDSSFQHEAVYFPDSDDNSYLNQDDEFGNVCVDPLSLDTEVRNCQKDGVELICGVKTEQYSSEEKGFGENEVPDDLFVKEEMDLKLLVNNVLV